jgi:hypothetical protein
MTAAACGGSRSLPVDHPIQRALRTILSSYRAGEHPDTFRNSGRLAVGDVGAIVYGLARQEMQPASRSPSGFSDS